MQRHAEQTPTPGWVWLSITLAGLAVPVQAQSSRAPEFAAGSERPGVSVSLADANDVPGRAVKTSSPQGPAARQPSLAVTPGGRTPQREFPSPAAAQQSVERRFPTASVTPPSAMPVNTRREVAPGAARTSVRGDTDADPLQSVGRSVPPASHSPIRLTALDGPADSEAPARFPRAALSYQEPTPPGPVDLGGLAIRLVVGTATVLGVCVAGLWLARRWLPHGRPTGKGQGRMAVLETLALSHRACVQLVEVEHRHVLIASDVRGIRSVTPLPRQFADEWEKYAEQIVPEATDPVPARTTAA